MKPTLAALLERLAGCPNTAERAGFLSGVKFANPDLFALWLAYDAAEWERTQREEAQERLRRRYVCGPWLSDWMT